MAITLCGFSLSNYYNKVKLALLEKEVPFTEEAVGIGSSDEAVLAASPLGKIPFIRLDDGSTLCESQVIVDYVEAAYPAKPLLPADPVAAAKVRELATFIDLHLELVARELYGQAFFGAQASDAVKAAVAKKLAKNVAGFQRLAKFSPYIAGDSFTLADCSGWVSLPLVALASKLVLGSDVLAAAGIDWKGYARMVEERHPHAARVAVDRKAAQNQARPV